MGAEESKKDDALKRVQLILAVSVGMVTLVVGVYNAKNLLFSKKGPGTLSVAVISERDQPVAGATVELYSAQSALICTASTGAAGDFQKKDLEAGNYTVKISRSGFEAAMLPVSVQPQGSSNFKVTLRPTGSPLRAALEEAGASWIKGLGAPKQEQDKKNSP